MQTAALMRSWQVRQQVRRLKLKRFPQLDFHFVTRRKLGSAPASGAVFRALAENTGRFQTCGQLSISNCLWRAAHTATPELGAFPITIPVLRFIVPNPSRS